MEKQLTAKRYSSRGINVFIEGYTDQRGFIRHGDVTLTHGNGKLELTGKYLYGKPVGKWRRWYENGTLESEHTYLNGLLNGAHAQYWDNGRLAREGNFKAGYPDGEHKMFDREQKLVRHAYYKKRKLVAVKAMFKSKWLEYDLSKRILRLPFEMVPEKICILDQQGRLRCKSIIQLWKRLLEEVSPDQAEKFLNALNDLHSQLGFDENSAVLTSCSGTLVATSLPPSGRPGGGIGGAAGIAALNNKQLNKLLFDDVMSACTDVVATRLEEKGISPKLKGTDPGTNEAVSWITEQIANCHDDNSMISGYKDNPLPEGMKRDENGHVINTDTPNTDGPRNSFRYAFPNETAAKKLVIDAASKAVDIGSKAAVSAASALIDTASQAVETGTNAAKAVANVIAFLFTEFKGAEGEAETAGEDGSGETETIGAEGEKETDGDESAETPGPESSSGGAGIPDGDSQGSGSKCEQLAEWWASKLAMCEATHFTSYSCQEILRFVTGCADPTLVRPSPDGGDAVCPLESGMTDAQWRQWECERKGGLMTMPDPNGKGLCQSYSNIGLPDFPFADPKETDPPRPGPEVFVPFDSEDQLPRTANIQHFGGTKTNRAVSSYGFGSYSNLNPLDDLNFGKTIEVKNKQLHFVVFASKACGPCHKVLDVFHHESSNFPQASFHYVDISQNRELFGKFQIRYTPTILVFQSGKIIGQRKVGAASKDVLTEYIRRSLMVNEENNKGTAT